MSDAISTCAGYVFALISASLPDTESSSGMVFSFALSAHSFHKLERNIESSVVHVVFEMSSCRPRFNCSQLRSVLRWT